MGRRSCRATLTEGRRERQSAEVPRGRGAGRAPRPAGLAFPEPARRPYPPCGTSGGGPVRAPGLWASARIGLTRTRPDGVRTDPGCGRARRGRTEVPRGRARRSDHRLGHPAPARGHRRRRWARRCCAPRTRRSSTRAGTSPRPSATPRGAWSPRPSTCPIHVGAIPWAVRSVQRVLRRPGPARRRLPPERPVPRQQPPARPDRLRAGVRRRPPRLLVDQPLAPERHRRRDPRRLQPRRDRDLAGGAPHHAAPALRGRAWCGTTC